MRLYKYGIVFSPILTKLPGLWAVVAWFMTMITGHKLDQSYGPVPDKPRSRPRPHDSSPFSCTAVLEAAAHEKKTEEVEGWKTKDEIGPS